VPAGPIRRPATVTVAAALTWVVCGATLLLFGVVALLLIVAQDQLIESVRREVSVQSLNSSQLLATLWLASAIIMFWCLVAIVLAVLTVQGYSWARFTLVASAVVAAVFTVFTFPVGLLNTIASVAVIILLFTGGANAWFAQRGASRSQGGPPSGGPSSGGPLPPAPPPPPREKPPSNVW
jgi:hypothetical protein